MNNFVNVINFIIKDPIQLQADYNMLFFPDFKPVTNVYGDQNEVETVPHFFPDKNTKY